MKSVFLVAFVPLWLGSPVQEDFFPLKTGTVWTYVNDGGEGKVTLAGREKIGETETLVYLSEHADRVPQREFLAIDATGVRLLKLAVGESAETFDPPLVRFKRPPAKDDAWEWKGDLGKDKAVARFRNEGEEEIKVPAGTYKAWKITVAMEIGNTKTAGANWYAAGVGLVRQVRAIEVDGKKTETVLELKSLTIPK